MFSPSGGPVPMQVQYVVSDIIVRRGCCNGRESGSMWIILRFVGSGRVVEHHREMNKSFRTVYSSDFCEHRNRDDCASLGSTTWVQMRPAKHAVRIGSRRC